MENSLFGHGEKSDNIIPSKKGGGRAKCCMVSEKRSREEPGKERKRKGS